jgi:hypothetical protein
VDGEKCILRSPYCVLFAKYDGEQMIEFGIGRTWGTLERCLQNGRPGRKCGDNFKMDDKDRI